jgi:hypothetical protein
MPSSPREGQEFVGFKLDNKLLSLIDKARGFADRSLWFRQAIAEKLKGMGMNVTDDMIFPPPRAGSHRHAVVMEAATKPAAEQRREVKYEKPKRTRKP